MTQNGDDIIIIIIIIISHVRLVLPPTNNQHGTNWYLPQKDWN